MIKPSRPPSRRFIRLRGKISNTLVRSQPKNRIKETMAIKEIIKIRIRITTGRFNAALIIKYAPMIPASRAIISNMPFIKPFQMPCTIPAPSTIRSMRSRVVTLLLPFNVGDIQVLSANITDDCYHIIFGVEIIFRHLIYLLNA